MKTSVFLISYQKHWNQHNIKEILEYVKNDGFDAAEPCYAHELKGPEGAENAKAVKEEGDRLGLDFSCFSHGINLLDRSREEVVQEMKYCVDMAKVLGASYFHHTFQLTCSQKNLPLYNTHKQTFIDIAKEIAYYAGEKGIECLYEDQGYLMNTPERMCELLHEVNLPNTGICLDVGNALFYDQLPETYAGILSSYIKHVHIKDYLRKPVEMLGNKTGWSSSISGNALRGTIVGHGAVNFEKIFSVLLLGGYDGYYSLEYEGKEETLLGVSQSLENMKAYYDRASKKIIL